MEKFGPWHKRWRVRVLLGVAKTLRWAYHKTLTWYVDSLVGFIYQAIRRNAGEEAAALYLDALRAGDDMKPVGSVPSDLADKIQKSQLGRKIVKIPDA